VSGYEYDDSEPYDDLAARLDRLEQAADESQYADSEDYLPQQIAAETLQDGLSAREYLAQVAEQTRQAVHRSFRP
jgi:hypothetical protein